MIRRHPALAAYIAEKPLASSIHARHRQLQTASTKPIASCPSRRCQRLFPRPVKESRSAGRGGIADGLLIGFELLLAAEAVGDLVPGGGYGVERCLRRLAVAEGGRQLRIERRPIFRGAADAQIVEHGRRVEVFLVGGEIV